MAPPTWAVGQVLTAGDVNDWFVPLAAYKTVNTVRSTLTASLDPDLQFSLPAANARYEVRAGIGYSCTAGGISFSFAIPANAGGAYEVAGPLGASTTVNANWDGVLAASSGSVGALLVHGLIVTGASTGTFGFQWASNSGPSSLTLDIYSYLIARRVG